MKKIIKLTESDLARIVKRVIKEQEMFETSLMVDPFSLTATSKGNIKITNNTTKVSHIYAMEAWDTFNWWDCTILDFPGGTKIKLTAAGKNMTIPADKTMIKNLLQSKFGQDTLKTTLTDKNSGEKREVKFTKIS